MSETSFKSFVISFFCVPLPPKFYHFDNEKISYLIIYSGRGCADDGHLPERRGHRQVIKERLNKAVKAEVDEKVGKGFGSIGSVFTKPVVKSVLKRKFHVDNYVVLSIGRLEMKDSEQIISVGLLNHVFTGSSERFQQEIDKALQGKKADSEEQEE